MTSQFSYQPQRAKKVQAKQASLSGFVHKEGTWAASQKERILQLIATAYNTYGASLQNQINFLHSNLQMHFGRRMQLFLYEKSAVEAHALFANDGKFLEVQHEEFMYVVWKVRLIEDRPDQKEV